jgi:hypothetical protein
LYHAGARYYDPSLLRFLSEDPERGKANRFAYAGNNPVTGSGLSGVDNDDCPGGGCANPQPGDPGGGPGDPGMPYYGEGGSYSSGPAAVSRASISTRGLKSREHYTFATPSSWSSPLQVCR